MTSKQIIKRLGQLEYGLTNGVSEYIEMLEEYLKLTNEIKKRGIK